MSNKLPIYTYNTKANGQMFYFKFKNRTVRGFKKKKDAIDGYMRATFVDDDIINFEFQELVDKYLSSEFARIRYSSFCRVESNVKNHILPNFPNKRISFIDSKDCMKFYNYLRDCKLSTSSKNKILGTFKSIFRFAKDYNDGYRSPATNLRPFRKTSCELIKEKERRNNVFSVDEFKLFISKVKKNEYRMLFTILFYTGLRVGEALALKWSDLNDCSITVSKSLTKKTLIKDKSYDITAPKNYSSFRKVQLNNALSNELNKYKETIETEHESKSISNKYIFGFDKPLAPTTVNRIERQACKDAGVKVIRVHDLRHSFASNLIARNVNLLTVSKMLGHKNLNVTLNTYAHCIQDVDLEALNQIDNMMK